MWLTHVHTYFLDGVRVWSHIKKNCVHAESEKHGELRNQVPEEGLRK